MLYTYIKFLSRIALRYYFYEIEINGKENLPKSPTPTLYLPNHQAAFLDPIIVGAYNHFPIHFITRSDVFNPISDLFYKRLNMMPIYRMRDGVRNLNKNATIFDKCVDILNKEGQILMFPEGNQEGDYYLRLLSKGFYRISQQFLSGTDKELQLVPVGINYFNHDHSGHKLILNFGEPIDARPLIMNEDGESSVETYKKTRTILSDAMKSLMVIPDYTENYPKQVASINRNAEKYSFAELREKLGQNVPISKPRVFLWLRYLKPILAIPNLPVHILVWYVLNKKMTNPLFESSLKIGFLVLLLPLWIGLVFIVASVLFGLLFATAFSLVQLAFLFAYSLCGRYQRA